MLKSFESLTVRQAVEMFQVFTGLETENRYKVLEPNGNEILFAYEESGFIGRQLLGGHRPLTLKVINGEGNAVLIARRRFFWFFSHLELLSPDGSLIGRMERKFKLIGRRFEVFDGNGYVGFIDGPLLRPHTFWLRGDGMELAKITKRWSGLSREVFTSADTFQVEFTNPALSESMRLLTLGMAFAIDLDFFENRGRGHGIGFGGIGGGGVSGRGF